VLHPERPSGREAGHAMERSAGITANAVMQRVEEGRLNLDRPVSGYLSRWQLWPGEFDNDMVTARITGLRSDD